MGFLSKLFGLGERPAMSNRDGTLRTTVQNPFSINNPSIGFLNLCGPKGEHMASVDQRSLSRLSFETRTSQGSVPSCSVLLLYCDIDQAGRIVGCDWGLRDLIKAAKAYIAVVASENPIEHCSKCLGPKNDWPTNIVFTLDRNGDKFPNFLHAVFQEMYAGKSMLTAWVELAPQIPGYEHPDAPSTIMSAGAGHLVFGQA